MRLEDYIREMEELAEAAKASADYPTEPGKCTLIQHLGMDLAFRCEKAREAIAGDVPQGLQAERQAAYWMAEARDLYWELRFTFSDQDCRKRGLALGNVHALDEFAVEKAAATGRRRRQQVRGFARDANEPRRLTAEQRHKTWLAADRKLETERPKLRSKLARARVIRTRLSETATADHIARVLPPRK